MKKLLIRIGVIMLIIFVIFKLVSNFIRLQIIAQLNLNVFGIIISLCGALVFSFTSFEFRERKIVILDKKTLFTTYIVFLVVMLSYFLGRKDIYDYSLFMDWTSLTWDVLFVAMSIVFILYNLGKITTELLFREYKFDINEKIVFYPLIGLFILAVIGAILPPLEVLREYRKMLPPAALLMILLGAAFLSFARGRSRYITIKLSTILQALCLLSVIAFRLYVFWYAVGDGNAFLKWDNFFAEWYVARINRNGLLGYLSAPHTERYPIFYHLALSSLSRILPFPLINLLVIIAFLIQVYSVLSYYLFSLSLTKDWRKSMVSVLIYNLLSGFSWLYLLTGVPPLADEKGVVQYIRQIHDKFGMYSGSTVSFQYIDTHTLIRLLSLSIFFSITSALAIFYDNVSEGGKESFKKYLVIFSLGALMIALGHTTDLILLSATTFVFILLRRGIRAVKLLIASLTLVGAISSVVSIFWGYGFEIAVACWVPVLAGLMGIAINQLLGKLLSKNAFMKIINLFTKLAIIAFIVYYFTSIIVFILNYDKISIRYPVYTLWFVPPIEWGFLGFIFVIYLAKILDKSIKLDFYEKYALLNIFLLLIFVAIIDGINLNYAFILLPYPIIPIYFFPFFGIVSNSIIYNKNFYIKKSIVLFLCVILALGVIDHTISSSYWMLVSYYGNIFGSPFPSYELMSIANTIYQSSALNNFEMAAIVTEYDPFPLNLSDYQFQILVRYDDRDLELKSILRAAGINPPEKVVEWAFFSLNDEKELLLLRRLLPIRYIILDKKTFSLAKNVLSKYNCSTLLETQKYIVYDLGKPVTPSYSDFLIVSEIRFYDSSLRLFRIIDNKALLNLDNVNGVIISNYSNENTLMFVTEGEYISATLPVRININGKIELDYVASTWKYFPEACLVARKIIIYGNLTFNVITVFKNKIYIDNFGFQGQRVIIPPPWHVSGREEARRLIKSYYAQQNIPLLFVLENKIIIAIIIMMIILLTAKAFLG